jgi:hypothetical protein
MKTAATGGGSGCQVGMSTPRHRQLWNGEQAQSGSWEPITLDTAIVYPGQALIEGSNLSEGRGTTRPFELFGALWIDGFVLSRKLNQLTLPGVKFREAWFTPTFHFTVSCGQPEMRR